MDVKRYQVTATLAPVKGSETLPGPIGTYGERKNENVDDSFNMVKKIIENIFPMNLKYTSMTYRIKLTDNFGPLTTTFSFRSILLYIA